MRCYVVDEIPAETLEKLEKALDEKGYASSIEKLYWIPLEARRLLPIQQDHAASCGPHCLALEILDEGVRLEFLVRAQSRMRCECVSYPSPETEREMMQWLDARIEEASSAATLPQ